MIIDTIQEWFKEVLIDGIISNLSGTLDMCVIRVTVSMSITTVSAAVSQTSTG